MRIDLLAVSCWDVRFDVLFGVMLRSDVARTHAPPLDCCGRGAWRRFFFKYIDVLFVCLATPNIRDVRENSSLVFGFGTTSKISLACGCQVLQVIRVAFPRPRRCTGTPYAHFS